MTDDVPEDYEPGEELMLMGDEALEVAEQATSNAVDRLEYVERLIPEPADGGKAEDSWYPKARAIAVLHDARELERELQSERRKRVNHEIEEYRGGE